jgi:hypothetical protein
MLRSAAGVLTTVAPTATDDIVSAVRGLMRCLHGVTDVALPALAARACANVITHGTHFGLNAVVFFLKRRLTDGAGHTAMDELVHIGTCSTLIAQLHIATDEMQQRWLLVSLLQISQHPRGAHELTRRQVCSVGGLFAAARSCSDTVGMSVNRIRPWPRWSCGSSLSSRTCAAWLSS